MARSHRVARIKAALAQRLQRGYHPDGDRFLSNRAVADRFGISYQTAHRLMAELADEGLLERRQRSGSFVPSQWPEPTGVALVFHRRAQRPHTFGHKLMHLLHQHLEHEAVPCQRYLCDGPCAVPADRVPVIWENRPTLMQMVDQRRPAILVNDRPPLGLGGLEVDSISVDDQAGGVMAGQLLQPHVGPGPAAIVAGPRGDPRSDLRVDGCQSVLDAAVFYAGSWQHDDAAGWVPTLAERGCSAVFCCNDRLAEAVRTGFAQRGGPMPAIVGFDDAPVAEDQALTTIAIPWQALAQCLTRRVQHRLSNQMDTARHEMLHPRPVIRQSA
jgi:DNA-binding transcriptional regulator YhcF (GntR family)